MLAVSISIFNVIFWIIIAIAFYILYNKGKEFTKDFENAKNPLGKEALIHQTSSGPVIDDARIKLMSVFDAMSSIFKLTEYATIISIIAAIVTFITELLKIFNL
ncbi:MULTISPECIES: hypothetical protein [Methanobacterium]|uniref:Uncharacterized protein n=1 Tax=Methanobacterium veterum TaxID=408577 RepID=A0A9E5A6S1_9EURY|nr:MULTISPECIES: hypothetical protein [Methanobacterium]MCZ3364893.1 hypothetical protein [Methanobacterium veterum]MCZ3372648.1 hypothetical protein [Methanobacterium veterum]